MIKEGHDKETYEKIIAELPKLNYRNQLALEIWNVQQSVGNMQLDDAMDFLNLDLNRIERYFIIHKMVLIKSMIDDHIKKESEKNTDKNMVNF